MSKSKSKGRSGSGNGTLIAFGIGVAALIGLFGWAVYDNVFKPKPGENAAAGAKTVEGLQTFKIKGNGHVNPGTKVTYETDPPVAGDHFAQWVMPGFYSAPQQPELLVHSLEHGYVVIYYDKDKLDSAAMDHIKSLTDAYKGQWDGVVAVPRSDAENPVVLTAWNQMLKLKSYDKTKAEVFTDLFRGRGPENRVR